MRGKMFNTADLADDNNNKPEKYSLRPRTSVSKKRNRNGNDDDDEFETWKPTSKGSRCKKQSKQKPPPLSRYRRKTANARERCRMREINDGFEALRRVLPQISSENDAASGDKLTKISTLRLAMRYITALNRILRDTDTNKSSFLSSPRAANDIESDCDSLFSGGEYASSVESNVRLSPVFGCGSACDLTFSTGASTGIGSRHCSDFDASSTTSSGNNSEPGDSKPSRTSISLASSLLPLPLDDDFAMTEFAIDAKYDLIDDVETDMDPLDGCLNDITLDDDEYVFDGLNYMANV